MRIRVLLDENLPPGLRDAILRLDPTIDILRVGDDGAPPLATLDPVILRYLEATQRLLVTNNRASIPGHINDHAAEGGHHWGITWYKSHLSFGKMAEAVYFVWVLSTAEEWFDHTDWIPL